MDGLDGLDWIRLDGWMDGWMDGWTEEPDANLRQTRFQHF